MAKTLGEVRLSLFGDPQSIPTRAIFEYIVVDGSSKVQNSYEVEPEDFDGAPTLHNLGTAGEFWKDSVDAIKAKEGIA